VVNSLQSHLQVLKSTPGIVAKARKEGHLGKIGLDLVFCLTLKDVMAITPKLYGYLPRVSCIPISTLAVKAASKVGIFRIEEVTTPLGHALGATFSDEYNARLCANRKGDA